MRGTAASTGFDASPLPGSSLHTSVANSTPRNDTPRASNQQSEKLTFMQEADWDPKKQYKQDPPTCLNCTIDWKVMLKRRALLSNTESNVVVAPGCYWRRYLKARVEDLVNQKSVETGALRLGDIKVVISVTEWSI